MDDMTDLALEGDRVSRLIRARIPELSDADLALLGDAPPDPDATRRPSESKSLDVMNRLDRIERAVCAGA